MIEPRILSDHEALSRQAAAWLADQLRERPTALVCLAAGSTPGRTYELLAERGAAEPGLVARCRWLKLDEWGGLAMDDPATCEHQLRSTLVAPLGAANRYTAFESRPEDPAAECARVADWLHENGPIDLCVLGLGVNGHLGFNEPADFLVPHAHVAQLSASSLTHAMLQCSRGRPTFGLTLGMADLLQSRGVLLLVSGPTKRGPLKRLLSGRITTDFPASLLHLHPRVTLLVDSESFPNGTG
jgi:galactosamine-6-phosphate isomerase